MARSCINAILLCIIISKCSGIDWAPTQVIDFFKAKNLFLLDAALCSHNDNLLLMRNATQLFPGIIRPVSDFQVQPETRRERLGIFVDLSCLHTKQLLSNINKNWFSLQFTWLVWDSEDLIIQSFLKLPMSTFSDVFKLTSYSVIRLHKPSHTLPMTQHDEGFWNSETGELDLIPSNLILDFKQSPLRIGIVIIEDVYNKTILFEQLLDKYFEPDMDVSNRFSFTYVQDIAYKYNFKVEAKFGDVWGVPTPDGHWKGLIKLLVMNEIDFTMSPMALIVERMRVSYAAVSTMDHWMVVVFKQPRASTTYRAMLAELSPSVWTGFMLLVILGALLCALTEKYCQTPNRDGSFVLGILQSVGMAANQGLSQKPQTASSRIVCLTMMLGCLLVLSYYSAGTMRALLTKSPPLIKTLDQMLANNIPLSAIDAPYIKHAQPRNLLFKPSLANKLAKKELTFYDQCESGILSILNGSAYVGDYYLVFPRVRKLFTSDIIGDLTVFPGGDVHKLVNYVINEHLRELFQRGILLSMETGVMKKERDYWMNPNLNCVPVVEFIHVPLSSITVALFVFGLGLVLSCTILTFEIYFARNMKEKWNIERKINIPLFTKSNVFFIRSQ